MKHIIAGLNNVFAGFSTRRFKREKQKRKRVKIDGVAKVIDVTPVMLSEAPLKQEFGFDGKQILSCIREREEFGWMESD